MTRHRLFFYIITSSLFLLLISCAGKPVATTKAPHSESFVKELPPFLTIAEEILGEIQLVQSWNTYIIPESKYAYITDYKNGLKLSGYDSFEAFREGENYAYNPIQVSENSITIKSGDVSGGSGSQHTIQEIFRKDHSLIFFRTVEANDNALTYHYDLYQKYPGRPVVKVTDKYFPLFPFNEFITQSEEELIREEYYLLMNYTWNSGSEILSIAVELNPEYECIEGELYYNFEPADNDSAKNEKICQLMFLLEGKEVSFKYSPGENKFNR